MDGTVADLIKNSIGLEVLTDTGWSKFDGLIDKGQKQIALLQLESTQIKATLDHGVFTDQLEKKSVGQLKPGNKIYTKKGLQSVVSIKLLNVELVYDLLNVANNRRFYANDILCSNCEFIIDEETLISPTKLLDLEPKEHVYKTGQVRWFSYPKPDQIYTVSLDPSLGTGGDPAAIQIFEANSTTQIGEWTHNRTPIPQQIKILQEIVNHLYETVRDENKIYYSIENNTIGEAALISLEEMGEENVKGYFLSDNTVITNSRRFRKGYNTTNKTKLVACSKMKNLIESGRMTVCSRGLISELKTFVAHGASYAAKPGESDDLIMATILAVRMFQTLQTFYADLDRQLKDHNDKVLEPMPFIAMIR